MASGMLRFTWDIAINVAKLFGKEERAIEAASQSLAKSIVEDTRPYVPYASGETDGSVRVVAKGRNLSSLVWESDHANIIYGGERLGQAIQFHTDVHSKAQAEWFEASKAANGDKWQTNTQAEIRSNWKG